MPEFDRFSASYRETLDRSVSVSGEGSAYFAEYKARYVAESLPRGFARKILDFGCGVGLLAAGLHRRLAAATLHGYDESAGMIAQVEPALARAGRFTSRLDDLDDDYAAIVVANVMHHVPRARRQVMVQGLSRRLAAGGRLMLFEHNPANPVTRWTVDRCPFDRGVTLLPPRETLGYVRGAGLRSVRCHYVVFFPRALAWCRRLERRLRWCPLGAQYVVVGAKGAGDG